MIQLYSNLPTLDLHGVDRDYARILINDFISDNYKAKNLKVVIIHGNGTGIIKKTTQIHLRIWVAFLKTSFKYTHKRLKNQYIAK